jgi:tRNA C32,U32 (ribose-2'-O)-methylase TrmJ
LLVGHEGRGIPKQTLSRCHAVLTIPQHGPVACLNAAVAGVIAMYEAAGRRPPTRTIHDDEYVVEPSERPGPANPPLQQTAAKD